MIDVASRAKAYNAAIRQLTEKYVSMWFDAPDLEPELPCRFSASQQQDNENKLESQLRRFSSRHGDTGCLLAAGHSQFTFDDVKAIVGSTFFSDEVMNDMFFYQSEQVTKRFIDDAAKLDPSLSQDDIHQALRNLWVFNSIQMMLGESIQLTPSAFAYSLLYPVTDNGLDSAARTPEEKQAYLHWLDQWLLGDRRTPADEWGVRTAELLALIEKEYPPAEYCEVHSALSAIHHAQSKSILLHRPHSGCSETSLTRITIEKGELRSLRTGIWHRENLTRPKSILFLNMAYCCSLSTIFAMSAKTA